MKNCLFLLFAFLLSSCNGEIDVFIGKKKTQSTVGINSIVFSEDDVAQFEVISSAYSTLLIQNCQYQYIGMGLNETHSCSYLNNYAYDSITNQISWDTDYLENGEYRFSIDLLVDGASRTSEKTIILNRKNRNPALTNATLVSTNENEDFFLTLTATDPDVGTYDDALTFSCLSCPLGMSIVSGNLISYPAANVTTNFSFSVRVQDQYGGSSDLTISVDVNPINHAPVLASVADITFIENQTPAGELQLVASDVDGNTLTYSYICTPLCVDSSINSSTGLFTWTPILGAAGNYNIEFIVSDGSLTHSRTIVATVRSGNTAPIGGDINDQILRTLDFNPDAVATTIAFSATDADGDALSYSCFILNVTNDNVAEVSSSSMECEDSTFVTFDAVARTITLAANDVDRGFYRILLRASDSFTHTDEIFSVSVNRAIYRFALKMDAGYLNSLLPFIAKTNNRYIVDWGDGSASTFTSNFPTHSYSLSALGTSSECETCIELKVGGSLETLFYWTDNPVHTALIDINSTPFLEAKKQIYKVFTLGDLNWKSLYCAFNEANLVSFNSGFVSNTFNSAEIMFTDAIELLDVNMDEFDASNVTEPEGLSDMFTRTPKLVNAKLNGMNITGVKNLTCMFCESSIQNVDFTNMDFSTVQTMRWMFYEASNITKIDFSGSIFNKIAVYDNAQLEYYNLNDGERFEYMFDDAKGGEIDFSNTEFDVDHFRFMFRGAEISRIKFNNAKITVAGDQTASSDHSGFQTGDFMFDAVIADLVDFTNAEFIDFKNLNHAFRQASIKEVVFKDALFKVNSYAEMSFMFENSTVSLLNFSGATFDGPIRTEKMINNNWFEYASFENTVFLNNVDVTELFHNVNRSDMISFKGANLNDISATSTKMFEGARGGGDLDLSGIVLETRNDLSNLFGLFYSITNLSFKNAVFSPGVDLSNLLSNSYILKTVDLSGFVGVDVAPQFDYMFRNDSAAAMNNLQVNLSKYDNANLVYNSIEIPVGSTWNNYDSGMTPFYAFYCDYDADPEFEFGRFNTKNCIDPYYYTEHIFPAMPTF